MIDRPFPSLPHAMAALDEFPIAGAMRISEDRPGVDYDALVRARRILPFLWPDDDDSVHLSRVALTSQGGIVFGWSRPGTRFDFTIDPFALYAMLLDTTSTTREWTRATIDHAVADARSALGLPALTTAVGGPEVGAASVRAVAR